MDVETFDAADEAGKVETLKGIDATVPCGLKVKIASWKFGAYSTSITLLDSEGEGCCWLWRVVGGVWKFESARQRYLYC